MVDALATAEEMDGSEGIRWGTRCTAGEGEEHSEALTLSVPRVPRPTLPPSGFPFCRPQRGPVKFRHRL